MAVRRPKHLLMSWDSGTEECLLTHFRHPAVRFLIAMALKKRGWSVEEEIFCLASNDSVWRADIIAFQSDGKAIIVDPTIRFEMGRHQVLEVHEEKKKTYL